MTFLRIFTLVLATLLLMAACGKSDEQVSALPDHDSNKLLAFVPADTPYLAANLEALAPVAGEAVAHMIVRQDMVNGFDVCHGGLLFTLADTAFAFACNAYDDLTFAAAASIDFLRPARLGDALRASAREDYRGSRSGFYTVAVFRGRSASKGKAVLAR